MTAAGLPPAAGMSSIGAVLTRLKPEFPDVSISKIRFLESEGLVTPHRTPSGYRQFSTQDIERLRYVLAAQRDHYLPLKVIKEQLDALDRGLEPATPSPRLPRSLSVAPNTAALAPAAEVRMTRVELRAESGLSDGELSELEQYGLLARGVTGYYDAEAALIAATVAELLAAGLEVRHLRAFKTAADREASLISQLVSAQARQRDPDARERAGTQAAQLSAVAGRLHQLLTKTSLRRELGH